MPAKNSRAATAPATKDEPAQPAENQFLKLGLSPAAARGAGEAGFICPTAVQSESIPVIVSGEDVIVSSETGSGKTAAFALPIFDRIDYDWPHPQALVLVPTRELCRQVAEAFRLLASQFPLRLVEIYGGVGYGNQRKGLAAHPHVVVGTPGRILDFMGNGELDLESIALLVLDEADRMLDMGFAPQLRRILADVPAVRQTLMFSATIPEEIARLAKVSMTGPVRIQVGELSRPPDLVSQEAIEVMPGQKEQQLLEAVTRERGPILIFTSTKVKADEVYRVLRQAGEAVCVIHSNRNQVERQAALDAFSSGKSRVMVATDVASRGLDVTNISLVINYDLPTNAEDYVHRIGRTGRALATGRALSFVTYRDYPALRLIERLTGHKFDNLSAAATSISRRTPLKRRNR